MYNYTISSIIRESDKRVFTLGEEVVSGKLKGTIVAFELTSTSVNIVIKHGTGYISCFLDRFE